MVNTDSRPYMYWCHVHCVCVCVKRVNGDDTELEGTDRPRWLLDVWCLSVDLILVDESCIMTSASTDQWKRTYDAVMWTVFILSEYTLASIVNNLNVIGIHRLMKKIYRYLKKIVTILNVLNFRYQCGTANEWKINAHYIFTLSIQLLVSVYQYKVYVVDTFERCDDLQYPTVYIFVFTSSNRLNYISARYYR